MPEERSIMGEDNSKILWLVEWHDTDKGIVKRHGLFKTKKEAMQSIKDWWKLHDFKPDMLRTWGEEIDHIVIDYGLYDAFYHIVKVQLTYLDKQEDEMADFKTEWHENLTEKALDENCEDNVNHPSHYTYGGIETIDYMKAKSTPEEFYGHLRLTALKYLSRAGHKDDMLQDYKKAQWYLNRLVKELEGESNE